MIMQLPIPVSAMPEQPKLGSFGKKAEDRRLIPRTNYRKHFEYPELVLQRAAFASPIKA